MHLLGKDQLRILAQSAGPLAIVLGITQELTLNPRLDIGPAQGGIERVTLVLIKGNRHLRKPLDGLVPLTQAQVFRADEVVVFVLGVGFVLLRLLTDGILQETVHLGLGSSGEVGVVLLHVGNRCGIEICIIATEFLHLIERHGNLRTNGLILVGHHLLDNAVKGIVVIRTALVVVGHGTRIGAVTLVVKPLHLSACPVVEVAILLALVTLDIQSDDARTVFHAFATLHRDSLLDVCLGLLLVGKHKFEPCLSGLPHSRLIGLLLADGTLTQTYHLLGLGLGDVTDKQLAAESIELDGIVGLLGIVDEVLQQERQHARLGIGIVHLVDGGIGTALVVDGHQTAVVALFHEDVDAIFRPSGLIERTGVDVLHHVLIDAVDVLAGGLFPELHVFGMITQQHVRTHIQQSVLTAQTRAQLRVGIGADSLQRRTALGQFLLGGIVPLVALHVVANLQVTRQLVDVALHEGVVLLLGHLRHLLLAEPKPVVFAQAHIHLPVVGGDALHAIGKVVIVVKVKQIIVERPDAGTGQHGQRHNGQQTNDDKFLHRSLVYIC